ncbi:probable methyltransferase-like protein 25 [Harmonia axyridis]|uniref:probable methyltransferase-like protein 25 n=1 Tax=Harmonia axyridis TaxID=115357 RepID=UPI001E27727F|nr:probable methyltransferase-like protein 25 [Harmonia axyridis]
MNSIQLVQYHVEKILLHLEPLLPLANCHMVDFFTNNIFKTCISPEIRSEINSMSHTQVIQNIFAKNFTNLPLLGEYFESCKACSLLENGDVCLTLEKFYDKLESFGCKDINGLKLNIFMSQKKSHEVEILSSIVASLKEIGGASHIIDVGDGKGYLSSMLALHHKIPVLGIDASPNNSKAAVERVQKLEKIWHSVYDNPKKSVPKKNDQNCTPSDHLYKQVTKYVEPDKNFVKNAADVFEEEIQGVSLVGLHTCGNLAPTCLRIFNEDPSIKTLSNVGCCYHLMNEKFESDCGEHLSGFPMSDYLNKKKFTIGRNARMVASQSVNRIFSNKELPDMSIFYRALLQLVLETKCKELPTRTVGKTRKKFNTNFVEYTYMALKKLEVNADDLNISDDYLKNLYNEYEARLSELNIFYLIRCMTSPVTESLIILDRLLFLLEQGYDNSFLVQLFDPVVSPRCFGVISLKI